MFWRLRVLLFYATIGIHTLSFFLLFVVLVKFFRVGQRIRYKFAVVFSYIFIWLAKYICGLRYSVSGLEKLPKTPYIVLANHQSFWENVFMQLITHEHSWVIKRELFNIPFFGWGLKMAGPIAVDRSSSASVNQILNEGKKKLDKGLSLIIFPESTRLRPEQSVKFKPSAAKLATIAKVPVVLIVHNAGIYWPKGFWIKKPGTIKVKVVDVIEKAEIENIDARILADKVQQIINREKQLLLG